MLLHADASMCASDPLRGVYHSYRLEVLGACRRYEGTVIWVRHEQDGDYHVVISPSPGYVGYLNATNNSQQGGGIVAEIMPGQTLQPPSIGGHVVVIGTWVLDSNHGWNEIHPIWAMGSGGELVKSLPPITPEYGSEAPAPPLNPSSSKPASKAGAHCTPGYWPCLLLGPSDYDCAGGSGNGPAYTQPGVVYTVTGSDQYRLDANGNGLGCE